MSEVDVGGMAVKVKPFHQYSVRFCCHVTLHVEKIAITDVHQCLLNIYGNQTVDVSTVRQKMAHFSGGDSKVKEKLHSRQPFRFL